MRKRHLRILGPESRDVLHDLPDSGYRRVAGLDNAWASVVAVFCTYLASRKLIAGQIGAQFGCIVSKMHGAAVLKAPLHENDVNSCDS